MCKSTKIECPRCGGSGETEFTHVVRGVCFMCKGEGMVYPKRVVELTEKAKVRKANKDAKYQQELKESKEREDARWEKIYAEITKRNNLYFNNYKCNTSEGALHLYKQIKKMSKALCFNEDTSEGDVREMFSDYFKSSILHFRLDISKYTLKYHNFCFVDLDGKVNDFTDCMHEVQNLIKK